MQSQFIELHWTPRRIEKIASGHGVTPDEVEEAFYDDEHGRLFRSRADRYLYCGRTHAGRPVLVVLIDEGRGLAGPISAREPTDPERRRYFD
jgi:uncharacterized DUF497 family protein